MSSPTDHPARLFVILARQAPAAVIMRRGPSGWVRLIAWNTAEDRFEGGQWFHGHIYTRRCDLSPDGGLFIYFAGRHSRTDDPSIPRTWTAISKPPYLTAVALWPKGDAWNGGGLFLDERTVWLNHWPNEAEPHPRFLPPKRLRVTPSQERGGEDFPIYGKRLVRDGWTVVHEGRVQWGYSGDPPVWRKPDPTGPYQLEMTLYGWDPAPYGDPYRFEYALIGDEDVLLEGVEWADWDQRGRLVVARAGRLYAMLPNDYGPDVAPIADFNDQVFEPIITPGWARRW